MDAKMAIELLQKHDTVENTGNRAFKVYYCLTADQAKDIGVLITKLSEANEHLKRKVNQRIVCLENERLRATIEADRKIKLETMHEFLDKYGIAYDCGWRDAVDGLIARLKAENERLQAETAALREAIDDMHRVAENTRCRYNTAIDAIRHALLICDWWKETDNG